MKNTVNKKYLVVSIMLMLTGSFLIPSVTGDINKKQSLLITLNQTDSDIEITYEINDFEEVPVIINEIEYFTIFLEDESNILLEGVPDIPNICRSIVIPDTTKMEIEVVSFDFIEYNYILQM